MAQHIKPQIQWTQEKIELLKNEYPLGDKKKLAKILGVKYTALKTAAQRFEVKSLTTKNKFRCTKLLDDSLESTYWQGFIMGDGNVLPVGRFTITLSVKDISHLEKLNKYIPGKLREYETTTSYGFGKYIQYTCSDKINANAFLQKYKLTTSKTTNPPDLSVLNTPESFIAFFVGFFDADGCFDYRGDKITSLKIEIHKNWTQNLYLIQSKLLDYFGIESSVKATSRGYVKLVIFKNKYIKQLKQIGIDFKLPVLTRKWDSVNLNYTPKKHIFQNSIELIKKWREENKSWKEIANNLGLKERTCKDNFRKYLTKQQKSTILYHNEDQSSYTN